MPSKVQSIEHMMHKGGKFKFSCDCDEQSVLLLNMEACTLYKAVQKIPVFPSYFAKLEPELIRRSIFGTAAIEGNPLTEEQTNELLATEVYEFSSVTQAEQEIHNLRELYAILQKDNGTFFDETCSQPSENLIKEAHKTLTSNLNYNGNIPGCYRNIQVQVGDKAHGGVYTPPRTLADITKLMQLFEEWINSDSVIATGPFIRAALAHYYFVMIHPFQDGNGRTARFLEAHILTGSNISLVPVMMSNYYYRNIDAYFSAFSASTKQGSVTPFLEFFFRGVIQSLEDIQEKALDTIKPILFMDYVRYQKEIKGITVRQHELLQVLENNLSFTLSELFTKVAFKYLYQGVSESTARRDIKKLVELDLIVERDGRYQLNFEVLA